MTPDQFRQLLVQNPFVPLRPHLNSGEIVEIGDPGCVLIFGATLQVFTIERDRAPILEDNRYIPLRSIAQVEQTTAA
ncbi:MAG: hypothetical protein ABSB33_13445 [Tepidisphaeraceae bacterium]|jgi:hypothetical protein